MRLRGALWIVLALVALLIETTAAFAGIASLRLRWPQDKQRLSICFFGGSPESRGMIARIAQEWTRETSISFDFGAEPEFNSCGGERKYDVRVGFDASGSWSYNGSSARNVAQDKPTMNLHGIGEKFDVRARKTVLHEFGHVLGLLHEEQNPQAGCREELDADKIRAMGITQQALDSLLAPVTTDRVVSSTTELDQNKQRTLPNNGDYISTGFDPKSVMRLFWGGAYFKTGEQSKCNGPDVEGLSEDNIKLVRLLYPPKPAEVSAKEGNLLTIRFSGVLAPEHYGHVLAALYEKGKLGLKTHVLLEFANDREGRAGGAADAPQRHRLEHGRVPVRDRSARLHQVGRSQPLEQYRRHQKLRAGARPGLPGQVAAAVRAVRAQRAHGALLGALQRRLRRPPRTPCAASSSNRFDGCESWDDKCRALIKTMNAQHTAEFTTGPDLLPAKFSGKLRLPGEGYRLVVKYDNEADRVAIEEAVKGVVEKRAKDLNIRATRSSSASPIPPARRAGWRYRGACSSFPSSSPLLPIQWRQDYVKPSYRKLVDVGIWDLGADTDHCLLAGVVHVTRPRNPSVSTSTLPPEKAPKCGEARTNGYQQSLPFDHGTGVAGILAAHSSGAAPSRA